jgi:MFS family permease
MRAHHLSLAIPWVLGVGRQLTKRHLGVNLMVYYATIILANVGLSAFDIGIVAAVMQTFFALGTYPLPRTIERFGRRGILMWTALICGVCLIVFVIMIGIPNQTKATEWVAVASLFVCLFSFGYGWCGVPWIYAAEVSTPLPQKLQTFYPRIVHGKGKQC